MLGASFGAAIGIGIRYWANALAKKHPLARPWNYVLFGGVGCYIGCNYSKWELELLQKVNEKRMERGLPTIEKSDLLTKRN